MTGPARPVTVLCNGATAPGKKSAKPRQDHLVLDYRGKDARVAMHLPDFVQGVVHLPDRVLDLLELAAYLFAADRSVARGGKDDLEYHGWSRRFRVLMKVRDHAFWRRQSVQQKLGDLLKFMSGDRGYDFTFQPGHSTPATSLFDKEGFSISPEPQAVVAWFSGGLDSLAGVVDALAGGSAPVYPISHQSGLTATIRTQDRLVAALDERFPKRLRHYKFRTHLRGERALEETQRTRAFLYAAIAFALAQALRAGGMTAFENGVTAINFVRRADLLNARATRTAHPKTIWLMRDFLSEVLGEEFRIETPFLWKTKTDVVELLAAHGAAGLITSAVSCSKTFKNLGPAATHCGACSQCIDRRFAAYAAGLQDVDEAGNYADDFLTEPIRDRDLRTTLVDYVRQAKHFAEWNIGHFQEKLLSPLSDIVGYTGLGDDQTVEHVHGLCRRHGGQVAEAIQRMRQLHDHPYRPAPSGSFLKILSAGEHLAEAPTDCDALAGRLADLPPGDEHADAYEKLVREILEAVFTPDLSNPRPQQRMDRGRKRIDLVFDNHAAGGFFARLRDTHRFRCPWVLFECKNYTGEIGNPEFDQLAGRLMKGPTKVGFIVCRKTDDRDAARRHCQDRSGGGNDGMIILVLEDSDLTNLLGLRARGDETAIAAYMEEMLRGVMFRT